MTKNTNIGGPTAPESAALPSSFTVEIQEPLLDPATINALQDVVEAVRTIQEASEGVELRTARALDSYDSNLHTEEKIDNIIKSLNIFRERMASRSKDSRKESRRRSELPDPTQRADSEINRNDARLQVRLQPEFLEAVEQTIKAKGITKKQAVQEALELWMMSLEE